ncbi:MAG: glycosyltransferase [Lachnospiraceae bacterium]|nr:glycosyltransferase [Lachnospiraceae bacterium]
MKKKLCLITHNYPNDTTGDSCFIQNEIGFLAESFDVTVICTGHALDRQLPCTGRTWFFGFSLIKTIPYMPAFFFCREGRHEWSLIRKEKRGRFLKLKSAIREFSAAVWLEKKLRKRIADPNEYVFYSYWCDYPAIALSRLKDRYPDCRMITRLHGFDLYEERDRSGRQPLKWFVNEKLDRLIFIGQNPMDYYLSHHPDLQREKASLQRLGIIPIDASKADRIDDAMLLLSCSSVIPLKRVDMIARALASCRADVKIRWVHIGSGSDLEKVRQTAQELLSKLPHISYEFKGALTNAQVRDFYEKTTTDCFITTSSSEGCPVSIMEALSASVPVIGTDVGDIQYMIDHAFLLPKNPEISKVTAAIEKMYDLFRENGTEDAEYQKLRVRARETFEELFDAEKNAGRFIRDTIL